VNPVLSFDGSFSATMQAPQGTLLTANATNANGTTSVPIGEVPFAGTTTFYPSGLPASHFRRVLIDGTRLVAGFASPWSGADDNDQAIYAYDSSRSLQGQTPTRYDAGSIVQTFEVANGWAYVLADDLVTIELATGTAHHLALTGVTGTSLAVAGNYLYLAYRAAGVTGPSLQVYDVTNPAAPSLLGSQTFTAGTRSAFGVRPFGASKLALLVPGNSYSGSGSVLIVDRSDPAHLQLLGVAGHNWPTDAVAVGNMLYTFSDYDPVMAIDVTNPAAPLERGSVMPRGAGRDVRASGTNELVVADTAHGLTFIDVTDTNNLIIKGTQAVPGAAEGVFVVGKTIWVAADRGIDTFIRP
jgi:hypothetical protein